MTDPSPATAKQAARKPSRARAERVLPTGARRLRVSDIGRPPRWLCNVRPHSSRRIFGSRLAPTPGPSGYEPLLQVVPGLPRVTRGDPPSAALGEYPQSRISIHRCYKRYWGVAERGAW